MGSCKKEHTVSENLLEGKIKQIVFKDSLSVPYLKFSFYYDSLTSDIHSIYQNDTIFCLFNKLDNQLLKLTFIKNNDSVCKYVHTNNNNSILSYNNIIENDISHQLPIYANYTSLYLDTIVLEDFLDFYSINSCNPSFYKLISKVKCYNLLYENNNCKEITFSYDNKLMDPCNPSHDTGTIEFTYTTIKNDLQIPFQNQFLDVGNDFNFDHFYLMSLAKSNFGKVNYNLIKSKIYYNYLVPIRYDYDYSINSDGRVSEMIINVTSTSNFRTITDITYY